MKFLPLILAAVASTSSARAVLLRVDTSTVPVKNVLTRSLVQTGEARIGWISDSNYQPSPTGPLTELASHMFFLGGGDKAGTGTMTITNGQVSGSITGFDPSSATGESAYQFKQLYVLLMEGANIQISDPATDWIPWALVKVPVGVSANWTTGSSATGTKVLSMANASLEAAVGKLEIDGAFNATTGIGLTQYIPEPSSAVLFGLAGLPGVRRRRHATTPCSR